MSVILNIRLLILIRSKIIQEDIYSLRFVIMADFPSEHRNIGDFPIVFRLH
jgi:hypothetical protein